MKMRLKGKTLRHLFLSVPISTNKGRAYTKVEPSQGYLSDYCYMHAPKI